MCGERGGGGRSGSGAPNGSFRPNICSAGVNRLRYSNLIAGKTRDFFGETSARTFVTRGLINSCCFMLLLKGEICRLECKLKSASIFQARSSLSLQCHRTLV